jgi:hypothetical protein
MSITRKDYFALGDWNAICDRCGAKRKASALTKDWQGFMLCSWCYEPRHPQDFVRAARPPLPLPFTRPPVGLPEFYCAPMPELPRPGSISGRVWVDSNGNGQYDDTAGANMYQATVTLQTAAGIPLSSMLTEYDGTYSFTGLAPDSYRIHITPEPAIGFIPTLQDVGPDATDSDIDATGQTDVLVLTSGQAITGVNGGFVLEVVIPEPPAPVTMTFDTGSLTGEATSLGLTFSVAANSVFTFLHVNLNDPYGTLIPPSMPNLMVATSGAYELSVNDPNSTPWDTVQLWNLGALILIIYNDAAVPQSFAIPFGGAALPEWKNAGDIVAPPDWIPRRITKIRIQRNAFSSDNAALVDSITFKRTLPME